MGKISKTFKKVVLSAIALVGLTGVFIGTSFSAYKNTAVQATVENESSIYDFSYENNELKLLFNANLGAYKNLNKDTLRQLKNDLVKVAQDAIMDDLQLTSDKGASPLPMRNPKRAPGATTGVPTDFLIDLIGTQLTDKDAVDTYYQNSGADGSYDVLMQLYVQRYAESYVKANPAVDIDDVKQDLYDVIPAAVQQAANEAYEGTGEAAPDIKSNVEASIAAADKDIQVSISDVAFVLNVVQDAINDENSAVTIEGVLDQFSVGDTESTIKGDILNTLKDSTQEGYVDEVVDLLKDVDPSTMGKVIKEVGFTNDDMLDVIDAVGTSNLIDIANEIGEDGIRELFDNVDGFDKDTIVDKIKSDISVQDIIKAVKSVEIGGEVLYDVDNGGLNGRGLVNLLKTLPRPNEIRNWTSDNQARLSYNVKIVTSLGEVEFKLTVGFFGNVSLVARVFAIIDDAIDISYENGELNVTVRAPQLVARLVKRICETNILSDDVKRWAYDLLFSSVDDIYNDLHGKSLDEYLELLKGVDYEKGVAAAISADYLNSFFHTEKFTDARIDKLVNGFMRLVEKGTQVEYSTFSEFASKFIDDFENRDEKIERAFNKFQSLLNRLVAKNLDASTLRRFVDPNDTSITNERIYGYIDRLANYEGYFDRAQGILENLYEAVPERYRDAKLMDYYVKDDEGNRSFHFEGEVSLNIEKLIKAATPRFGDRIVNALSSVLDKIPGSINLDFTAEFKGLYKVTYIYGDEQKEGLLPEGVDVSFFGNVEEINGNPVVKWVYANGEEVKEMPADDIEVYAVYDLAVDEIADVEKAYKEAGSVEATVTPAEVQTSLSYQWYKADGTKLDGQTAATLDLTEFKVADSGKYYVVVSEASFDGTGVMLEVKSNEFTVTITKALVEEPVVDPTSFVYNPDANAELVVPANDLYTVSGDLSKKDVGNYKATVKLVDKANYQWKAAGNSNDLTINWEITPMEVEKPVVAVTSFDYDGQEKALVIDNAKGSFDIEGDKATNAGDYEATVRLANANLVWKDTNGNKDPIVIEWKINPQKINKPTSQSVEFTYDGTEKTFTLPQGQYLSFAGDVKATNAGDYVVVIMLKNGNFVWSDGTDGVISVTWRIKKAIINVPAIVWNYTSPISYDGQEHTVEVTTQFDAAKIKVEYSGTTTAKNVGQYQATITLSPVDAKNYDLDNYGNTLSWEIVEGAPVVNVKNFESVEKTGTNPNATVKVGNDGLRNDYTFHAPDKNNDKNWDDYKDAFNKYFTADDKNAGWAVHQVYDVHFEDANGQEVTGIEGQFEVRILIPEELRDSDNLTVIWIESESSVQGVENVRKDGNYMVFNTNHFSLYAVAEKAPSTNFPIWPFIIIIVLLVVIIILQVLILLRKKKAKEEPKEEEPKEEPAQEPVAEEPQPEPEPEPEEEEPEVEEEEEEEEVEVVGADGQIVKKKRKKMVHFQTKLSRSDKDLRHKYYELRDYIKSFGINNRISIPCDTFSLHRKRYVVITIAGKRLKLYLAIDPAKYEGTPIPVEANKIKKYEDLPAMLKVKSDLSVKRAKAIVDEIMAAEGYERKE